MRNRVGVGLSGLASVLVSASIMGCMDSGACPNGGGDSGTPNVPPSTTAVFIGAGSPYDVGSLAIRTLTVERCDRGAPVPLRIHTPEAPGDYAVVVFQHGFMSRNDYYDEILTHLASHGFVVVAPQMYEPGIGPLTGNPTAAIEAELAGKVIEWLPGKLDEITSVHARTDHLGTAGHSRGGKVAWTAVSKDPGRFRAIAGVDPVDGTGGPFGGQSRVCRGRSRSPCPHW